MATSAGATRPADQITFAHNSERQFARLLDFYRVEWEYEPTAFPIEWDAAGRPVQHFRPDFYLPRFGLYIEITTLNQRLVTKKNRKVRRLRELYPDVRIKVLYQRDYLSLLAKYGLEPPSQLADPPAAGSGTPAPAPAALADLAAVTGPGTGGGPTGPGAVATSDRPGSPASAQSARRDGPGRQRPSELARPGQPGSPEPARPEQGGAVDRARAAGRPRVVVPGPPGATPPLPADPELVRLAQVPLPAEVVRRRRPARRRRAG